jgi:hypothetical protein
MPFPVIVALTKALQTHSRLLSIPIKQEVRHEHHLTKPVWAYFAMSLVIIGLLFLLYYKWLESYLHKENDLKYQYLEVFHLPEGQKNTSSIGQPIHFKSGPIPKICAPVGENRVG